MVLPSVTFSSVRFRLLPSWESVWTFFSESTEVKVQPTSSLKAPRVAEQTWPPMCHRDAISPCRRAGPLGPARHDRTHRPPPSGLRRATSKSILQTGVEGPWHSLLRDGPCGSQPRGGTTWPGRKRLHSSHRFHCRPSRSCKTSPLPIQKPGPSMSLQKFQRHLRSCAPQCAAPVPLPIVRCWMVQRRFQRRCRFHELPWPACRRPLHCFLPQSSARGRLCLGGIPSRQCPCPDRSIRRRQTPWCLGWSGSLPHR